METSARARAWHKRAHRYNYYKFTCLLSCYCVLTLWQVFVNRELSFGYFLRKSGFWYSLREYFRPTWFVNKHTNRKWQHVDLKRSKATILPKPTYIYRLTPKLMNDPPGYQPRQVFKIERKCNYNERFITNKLNPKTLQFGINFIVFKHFYLVFLYFIVK